MSMLISLTDTEAGTHVVVGTEEGGTPTGEAKELQHELGSVTVMSPGLYHKAAAMEDGQTRILAFIYLLRKSTWKLLPPNRPWENEFRPMKSPEIKTSEIHRINYVLDG